MPPTTSVDHIRFSTRDDGSDPQVSTQVSEPSSRNPTRIASTPETDYFRGKYLTLDWPIREVLRAALDRDAKVVIGTARKDPEALLFLTKLLEDGAIRPVIDRCYPLEQTAEAHRYVDAGHKHGNVVINVGRENDSRSDTAAARVGGNCTSFRIRHEPATGTRPSQDDRLRRRAGGRRARAPSETNLVCDSGDQPQDSSVPGHRADQGSSGPIMVPW